MNLSNLGAPAGYSTRRKSLRPFSRKFAMQPIAFRWPISRYAARARRNAGDLSHNNPGSVLVTSAKLNLEGDQRTLANGVSSGHTLVSCNGGTAAPCPATAGAPRG